MAREREFDRETVLDRAGELFWRLGYEVVSVQELEAATGLSATRRRCSSRRSITTSKNTARRRSGT